MTALVSAELLAIPDGANTAMVKLSVKITPSQANGVVALDQWPETIAEWGRTMRVRIADIVDGTVDTSSETVVLAESQMTNFLAGRHRKNPHKTRAQAARELWVEIFANPGFDALYSAVESDPTPFATLGPKGILGIATTRTGDLRLLLRHMIDAKAADEKSGRRQSTALWQLLGELLTGVSKQSRSFRDDAITDFKAILAKRLARTRDMVACDARVAFEERALELALLNDFMTKSLGADGVESIRADERSAFGRFVAEMALTLGLWDSDDPDLPGKPDENFGEGPVDIAKRKLFAIKGIPTLCHYFGLAIQVEIPRAAFGGRTSGAIAVDFVDALGQSRQLADPSWTAFALPAGNRFFPAADPAGNIPCLGGYLDLGSTWQGTNRYTLDTIATVNNLIEKLAAGENSGAKNRSPRRSGFIIMDHHTLPAFEQEIATARRAVVDRIANSVTLLHEHDLVQGFRPDFALAVKNATTLDTTADRWSTTTARTITAKHELLDPDFYADTLIKAIRHRDHGLTIVPPGTRAIGPLGGDVAVQEEELFSWGGESLAVARGMRGGLQVYTDKDLGITLQYEIDTKGSPDEALPPLREGAGYICGCRLVYQNGGGPDLATARTWYEANPNAVIGDKNRAPFIYPKDFVAAPDVHLKWDDPLIGAKTGDADIIGETSDLLVVRDRNGSRLRIVTPPRVPQDTAEIQRQFDAVQIDIPPGSLEGADGLWTFGPDGALPEARFRQIRWMEKVPPPNVNPPPKPVVRFVHVPLLGQAEPPIRIDSAAYESSPYRQARGTVAIIGKRRGAAAESPYFVDKHARLLKVTLSSSKLQSPPPSLEIIRDLWGSRATPNDAKPLILELVPSSKAGASFSSAQTTSLTNIDGNVVTMPLVRVNLGPAETYAIKLNAVGRDEETDANVLQLVHAVKRPVEGPIVTKSGDASFGIAAISVTVRKEATPGTAASLPTWAEVVNSNAGQDMLNWSSLEHGATTYFVGRVDVHRKSTGKLRCEAQWGEFDPRTVSRTSTGAWICNVAQRSEMLFQFEIEQESAADHVDLLYKQDKAVPNELRALSYAFPDGRARRLQVKLVATSSFTRFFPDAGPMQPGPDAIGVYEKQSSDFDSAPVVWTQCTFRPAPPKIDRVLPIFDWGKVPGKRESATRTTALRIHLDEGWYDSGEGEQLGIVLLRPEQAGGGVCSYEEDPLKPFQRFLTRVGGDPIWASAEEPVHLEPADFIEGVETPEEAQLFLATEQGVPLRSMLGQPVVNGTSLPVRILPMTPKFTVEDGLHCDLKINLAGSYTPFLRLALVRFQRHAVEHLRASHPIEQTIQILPDRSLWIESLPAANRRVFHMEGAGYSAGPGNARTIVDIRLFSWVDRDRGFADAAIAKLDNAPQVDATTGRMRWSVPFELPHADPNDRFALLIEEYEIFPAEQPIGSFSGDRAEFREVEQRRLVFSHLQRIKRPQ